MQLRVDQDRVRPKELSEVLGRLGFSSIAVDFIKPFLVPLYAWSAAVPQFANLQVPALLRLIFGFLSKVFRDPSLFMIEAWEAEAKPTIGFYGDAHASLQSVGVGGYVAGVPLESAEWFATELTPREASWAFSFGEETFRAIAALELYTTLLCVKMLPRPRASRNTVLQLTGGTDNQSNSYALKKWSTTAFPLCVILRELAVECRMNNIVLDLAWVPRQMDVLADALSNGVTTPFNKKKEIVSEHEKMKFHILEEMQELAQDLFADLETRRKVKAKLGAVTRLGQSDKSMQEAPHKKAKKDKLNVKDPWL